MPTTTEYNEILYPTCVHSQTHPDRLATCAILRGLKPAPVEQCRVLELGCNDGLNLISLATALPQSEFVGYDFAAIPIENGKKLIADLELTNVSLEARDIMQMPEDIEPFDYIIAHGLYSWVPEPVRQQILEICKNHLKAQGIAYISYNAYPGNHMRDLVRGIMKFHTQQFKTAEEKIGQSRALIKFLSESRHDKNDTYQALLKDELERITQYIDHGFYHDDLSEINQPFYFHQFVQQAQAHELQFLAETRKYILTSDKFKPEAIDLINNLEAGDPIAKEQHFDFLVGISFRQTLICHQSISVTHKPQPPFLQKLFFSSPIKADTEKPQLNDSSICEFTGLDNASIASRDPLAKNACLLIGAAWPRPLAFNHLLQQAQEAANLKTTDQAILIEHSERLATFLLEAYNVGFIEFHSYCPSFPTSPSEYPIASPLIREQIKISKDVTNLNHKNMCIEGDMAQALIKLLDGTRNQTMLADTILEQLGQAAITKTLDIPPETPTEKIRIALLTELEKKLKILATSGVLLS